MSLSVLSVENRRDVRMARVDQKLCRLLRDQCVIDAHTWSAQIGVERVEKKNRDIPVHQCAVKIQIRVWHRTLGRLYDHPVHIVPLKNRFQDRLLMMNAVIGKCKPCGISCL